MKIVTKHTLLYLILAVILCSCFEKETPIAPYNFTGALFPVKLSIYTNQQYYSFESNKIVSSCPNNAWDLSFESSPQDWHIRVNSSNFIEIYQTDTTNFSADFTANRYKKIINTQWRYDNSNGNPDSTAVGKWVNTNTNPFIYSGQVYLVGQFNGTSSIPLKKIVFTLVNDTSYQFTYADLNGNNSNLITIIKDTSCNASYFSISEGRQVVIEPQKNTWDILFSQYMTSLPDNKIFIPYPVRGVLLNPNKVNASLDSTKSFNTITINDVSNLTFSNVEDVIGYKWKSVSINFQANTGTYSIIPNYTYIVKDVLGSYYKFKFLSFYNSQVLEGYPAFEVQKL